jgi:hypothetical protein
MKKIPIVEFVNEIPGVANLMPVIEAKHYRHKWVDRAVNDFANQRENSNWKHSKFNHTARCPGIFTLQRHGWIIRTWQDITINTKKGSDEFTWTSASNYGGDAVGFHPQTQLYQYFENWPDNTLKPVIKINTGWCCEVPEGYYLMEMPVALSDEKRFSTIPGYFSKEAGPAHMNVQLLWHVQDGETLIEAGTPISQYVLVPKEQAEMSCRDYDEQKDKNMSLSWLYDASKFVKNYSQVKKLFGK